MRVDRVNKAKYNEILTYIFFALQQSTDLTLATDMDFNERMPCTTLSFTVRGAKDFRFTIWLGHHPTKPYHVSTDYVWNYVITAAHDYDWTEYKEDTLSCSIKSEIILDNSLKPYTNQSYGDVIKFLYYIRKQPYLARYRQLYGTDYNLDYVSEYEAKSLVKAHDRIVLRERQKAKRFTNKGIRLYADYLCDKFDRVYLIDDPSVSPRYFFVIGGEIRETTLADSGYYAIFPSKLCEKLESTYTGVWNAVYYAKTDKDLRNYIKKYCGEKVKTTITAIKE